MSRTNTFRRAAWLTALACAAAGAAQADALAPRPVGEVTMAVGPVIRTPAQGLPEAVHRGSPIMPGDRLDTADGGHVHIRFVDGELVSIRPGSRMWVEDYQYDPQHVANSLIKFKLEFGVARAISGAAAEGAKDRFRLNTPLVAIGVRGTDFVVRSSDTSTRAAVNQGAIIMAPLGADCSAQAVGPCGTPTARLLAADMGQVLVEYRAQVTQPEIKPLQGGVFAAAVPDAGASHLGMPLPHIASGPNLPPGPSGQPDSTGLVTTALTEDAVKAAISQTAPPAPPPPVVVPDPVPVAPPPVVLPPTTPPPPAAPPTLQWGRWAAVAAGQGDFSVLWSQAATGRDVTVGNDQFALYRATNGKTDLVPGLGSYQFSLDKSYAQYSLSGQVSSAAVQDGHLSLDFVNRQFATDLKVSNSLTGVVSIAGAGYIHGDGIFYDRTVPGQAIAGAAALDGKSAGYFFEKAIGAGTLSGITLWSRP